MKNSVVLISILTGVLAAASLAQSLGDAARQERQKKHSNAPSARRVITDDDVPQQPSDPAPAVRPDVSDPARKTSSQASSAQGQAVAKGDASNHEEWTRAGNELRSHILWQRDKIATMRKQVEKLRASVHFASKNAEYDATLVNVQALERLQETKRLEKQLEEETLTLQTMQQTARDAGYDSSVYDPQTEAGEPRAPGSSPQD